jgi:hypothetical protein
VHGDWTRCLNSNFGGLDTAVFLDPPYRGYEKLYGVATPVADAVEAWARENARLRIALCGHVGDYDLPGWDRVEWARARLTYGGNKTTDLECVWYSPACLPRVSLDLFAKLEITAPPLDDFDPEADARGSFADAIAAVGERVRAGEPTPTTGYFAPFRRPTEDE